MAQRDRATIGIYVCGVIRQLECPQHRERLRSESLVNFNDVNVLERPLLLGEQFLYGADRTHTHDAWRNPSDRSADDSRPRGECEALYCGLAGNEQCSGAIVDTR